MLRTIRIVLASLFWIGITLLILDVTGMLHRYLAWMAHMQLLPAVLALNGIVVGVLLLLTWIFGRVYCSVVCPLGVFQDIVARLGKPFFKDRYHFAKPHTVLRYGMLGLFVILLLAGANYIAILIAPYSAYGRMVATLFQPIYVWGNNLLAAWDAHAQHYLFYTVPVLWRGTVAFVVAIATFVMIGLLAMRYGRLWCNTVCPVGTLLGLVSRFSLFRITIQPDRCKNCKSCANSCKSMCIDLEHHCVDHSRCVACMDCLGKCKFDALHYRFRWSRSARQGESHSNGFTASETPCDPARRRFLATTALVAAGAATAASAKVVDGGLAAVEQKRQPRRGTSVKPAGSQSLRHFSSHCTSCMLCVSQCPQHVLQPSQQVSMLLQPEMQYDGGYCPPQCTRCAQVCPTGAIRPITVEEKTAISIGYAVVLLDNCIANTQGENCGACARHCPVAAIRMVQNEAGRMIPAVDENFCIGCGTCEYYCPARPFAGIYVEGRDTHIQI